MLEVGCGTGVLTRILAGMAGVGFVVGVDLAPSLLDTARELAADVANVRFEGWRRLTGLVDRGADTLAASATIGEDLAPALKAAGGTRPVGVTLSQVRVGERSFAMIPSTPPSSRAPGLHGSAGSDFLGCRGCGRGQPSEQQAQSRTARRDRSRRNRR